MKNTVNAIAAWCEGKLLAPLLYERSINSDVFFAWVTQGLLPELSQESVIVMDNATFHKREDVVAAIEKAGHKILWLAPYSPDLNPIEAVWAWIKAIRKRWKMDDIDRLFRYFTWIVNEDEIY